MNEIRFLFSHVRGVAYIKTKKRTGKQLKLIPLVLVNLSDVLCQIQGASAPFN